jgi:hypothetical protein
MTAENSAMKNRNDGVTHSIELIVTPAMRELRARRKRTVRMMGEDLKSHSRGEVDLGELNEQPSLEDFAGRILDSAIENDSPNE